MSSWLLMGLPGVAYLSGLAEASWTAIGLAVGTYLNWLIVARRIRRYSNHLDAITVPQFFSKRWGDDRNLLSAIAAVVIIIFFIPYLASGFSACGKLFASLFGTSYVTAMLISAAVIVIYTVMGGFLAASRACSVVCRTAAIIIPQHAAAPAARAGARTRPGGGSAALPGRSVSCGSAPVAVCLPWQDLLSRAVSHGGGPGLSLIHIYMCIRDRFSLTPMSMTAPCGLTAVIMSSIA